jgi:CheY-like chemotaxis protein
MSRLAGKRVLVVEDEPILAMALEDMLEDLGCEVVGPASRLQPALRLAREAAVDAAILDINLHGEHSHPVADLLRARAIPILFATGYGSACSQGYEDVPVLPKPYRQDRLVALLERLLG